MDIILYTIDCPNCLRLENKLREKNIAYAVCKDKELMRKLGMNKMPVLEIRNGTYLNFKEAIKWVNDIKGSD